VIDGNWKWFWFRKVTEKFVRAGSGVSGLYTVPEPFDTIADRNELAQPGGSHFQYN
jgi:hypothetical protein